MFEFRRKEVVGSIDSGEWQVVPDRCWDAEILAGAAHAPEQLLGQCCTALDYFPIRVFRKTHIGTRREFRGTPQ
jgi:hypothetical protein